MKKFLTFDFLNQTVFEKVLAYDIPFFELFVLIKEKYSCAYLFESLFFPRHQDRYHTIGFSPYAIFSARENTLTIEGSQAAIQDLTQIKDRDKVVFDNINPYHFLKNATHFNFISKRHQGGLIGYFCYEAVNYFEPSLNLPEHPEYSNFQLGLYTDGLIYDTTTSTLSYYSFYQDRHQEILDILDQLKYSPFHTNLQEARFLGNSQTKEGFLNTVERTKNKINQGYSFQAEVGFKSYYNIIGNKLAIYQKLRKINPGPYMFYLKFSNKELLGSSPEILVSNNQGLVLTTPTAGTVARGSNEKEDLQLARSLLNDSKEIAEHNMLIDLHRNDLARVCRIDSVKISDLMYIIKFSHVQHIVSNIVGQLLPNKTSFDLLSSLLPGGVVSGAPKIETIKIIANNEKQPRGIYGGAVGRFSFNGDCDFCLPIRSIFCSDNNCYVQTSAGIVYDSVPEREYQEVNRKLAAMKTVIKELNIELEA